MEKLCRAVIPFRPKIGDYRYLLARLTQTMYIKGAETDINFMNFGQIAPFIHLVPLRPLQIILLLIQR